MASKPHFVELLFRRLFLLPFGSLQNEQTTKKEQVTTTSQTLICRGNLVILSFRHSSENLTKQTTYKMTKYYFVVFATCTMRQNEQTTKFNFVMLTKRDKTNKQLNCFFLSRCTSGKKRRI